MGGRPHPEGPPHDPRAEGVGVTLPDGTEVSVLTLDQVAARLQVSRRTVNNLIRDGRIRPVRIGRSPRVTERELAAFLASLERPRRR